jgi:hypothetical protein
MFALLAFLCGLLAVLDVEVGDFGTTKIFYLGFMFLCLSLLVDGHIIGWVRGRREG